MQVIFSALEPTQITVENGLYSKRRRLESCYFIIAMVRLKCSGFVKK